MIQEKEKILIVRPDAIGDFILFIGCFQYLREARPTSHISLLVQDSLADFAKSLSCFDAIYPLEREKFLKEATYSEDLTQHLTRQAFDIVIYPVFSRDVIGDFLTLSIGAKKTIAFEGDANNLEELLRLKNNRLYQEQIFVPVEIKSEFERNQIFIETVLQEKTDRQALLPTLSLRKEDEAFVEDLLGQLCISEKFIVLSPFPQNEIREWPAYKWQELLAFFPETPFLICGSQENFEKGDALQKQLNHQKAFNLCGKTTLRECAALLKRASLNLGVETSLCHLATAVETPSVILLGGGHFDRFLPYSDLQQLVTKKMPCYGCNWLCSYEQAHCVTDIGIEDVLETLESFGWQPKRELAVNDRTTHQCFVMGSFYKRISQFEEAENWFQKTIKRNDNDEVVGAAYFHLGEMSLKQGKEAEAQEHFRNCLTHIPNHERAKHYGNEFAGVTL